MLTAKAAHRKDLSGKPATMTHQHYRQIAATLRKVYVMFGRLPDPDATYADTVWTFADELENTNPNFDRVLPPSCLGVRNRT